MKAKNHLKSSVRNILNAVEISPSTVVTFYRLFLAMSAVLFACSLFFIAQASTARALLIWLSVTSVWCWFFGVVYKLKALITPQNVMLVPDFKAPVLRVLTMSWVLAASLLAIAWLSPMFLVLACAGYCVLVDEKLAAYRFALQKAWLTLVLAAMIFLVVALFLSQRFGLVFMFETSVAAWAGGALFLAALGLACIFRAVGLVLFGLFVLVSLVGISSLAPDFKTYGISLSLLVTGLAIATIVMFYALRRCLVGLSIKRVTKLHQLARRDVAIANETKLAHPVVQTKEWLPIYDFGFNRTVNKPFRFDAMLELCLGRAANWLAVTKTVALFAAVVICVYVVIAFSGHRYADPNLKVVFFLCCGFSVLAGPLIALRFTVREQEMLSLSPRWPSAQRLNLGYLRLSVRHTAVLALPLLVVLIVAWVATQATPEVALQSLLAWLTFTTAALASKLVNKRTLTDMGEFEKWHHPLLFVFAFGFCFKYFPDALLILTAICCLVSCAFLVVKVRWFLSQGAVLPARRLQGALWNWPSLIGKGKL